VKQADKQNLPPLRVQKALDMSEADWAIWAEIRANTPALRSPYFHPDYTRLLADLRPDVPRPVGAPMSDYHAIITAEDDITYNSLLSGTGIGAYHYSCATDVNRLNQIQVLSTSQTAAIDIMGTADDWRASRDGSYRRHLKSNRRRTRKAEESIGPKRIDLFSRNIDVYAALLKWKREKFAQTGKYDVLSAEWTQSLIRTLWERGTSASLRCDMHALYFGDRLAAIDLGLSDGDVFHSWMVAYDDDLSE